MRPYQYHAEAQVASASFTPACAWAFRRADDRLPPGAVVFLSAGDFEESYPVRLSAIV